MASRTSKFHGKVEGAEGICAVPGCHAPGEFKAPLQPSDFDGPGAWRLLCLDHVREHNARYNYFNGMSPEEITEAQGPYGGWERQTRAFSTGGADPAPAWADFSDPLEAISARFQGRRAEPAVSSRFSKEERRALGVLGLGEDTDRTALRQRYSQLVRKFHPDRNGGDRSQESRLGAVIEAYTLLKGARAFA
ncbi:J domain-containing protein [Sphingomonas piscis]|uniref:J domain-containing protein n=1 Tax=Sphingomonas piscis TaxID=2714943 RepID=A0A6G7YQF0_9SPHN|nr:J domain-containing protein [Sphingomonas piscis]QIK78957.1 J domain-containing protein [Sphingomonas piscis]